MPQIRIYPILLLLVLLTSCRSTIIQGQFISDVLVDSVQKEKLQQKELIKMIGRPSYVPDYRSDIWYYIGRSVSRHSVLKPKVISQRIIKITFNNREVSNISVFDSIPGEISYIKKYTKDDDFIKKSLVRQIIPDFSRFNKKSNSLRKKRKIRDTHDQ